MYSLLWLWGVLPYNRTVRILSFLFIAGLLSCGGSDEPSFVPFDTNTPGSDTQTGNEAPVLYKIGDKIAELGNTLVIELQATDPNNDVLTFSAYGAPPDASFSSSPPRFVWAPQDFVKPVYVTFLVSDGVETDRETIRIEVVAEGGNHAPSFQAIGDQVIEVGQDYTLALQATDPDGDSLSFAHTSPLPEEATLDAQAGLFRWVPTAASEGLSTTLTFTATDGQDMVTLEVQFFVVAPGQNKPPSFEPIPPQVATVGQLYELELKAQDIDGDSLTFGIQSAPPEGSSFTTPVFQWIPLETQTGNQSITFTVSDGQYTSLLEVNITVYSQQSSGSCTDDVFEPNNTFSAAAAVSVGNHPNLSICDTAANPYDIDWYILSLASGQTLSVKLGFEHALGDIDMRIFSVEDPAVPLAVADSTTNDEVLTYPVPQAGSYLISVFGAGAGAYKATYTMEISTVGVGCVDDTYESNNSFEQAYSVSSGIPISDGQFCPNNPDFFRIDVGCGNDLSATLSHLAAEGDLDLYLYRESTADEVVTSATTSSNTENLFYTEAPYDETLYVLVTGKPPESTLNAYSLTLQLTGSVSCSDDANEPNEGKNKATLLLSPTDAITDLALCCNPDWFHLPLKPGDTATAQLDFLSGSVSAKFLAPDGSTILAEGQPNMQGLSVTLEAAEFSGSYYLVVEGTPGTAYSLDLSVATSIGCTSSKACPANQICTLANGSCVDDTCSSEADCPAGQDMPCVNFHCLSGCTYDADCKLDYKCKGFLFGTYCGSAGSKPTGASCYSYSACSDGSSCYFKEQGGYCTNIGCNSNADCGDGSNCIEANGITLCGAECSTNADCRVEDGFSCQPKTLPNGIPANACLPIP